MVCILALVLVKGDLKLRVGPAQVHNVSSGGKTRPQVRLQKMQ